MRQGNSDKPAMDVFSGVRWSALSKYGAQGTQLVVSIVLARLLAPESFGLLGMAMVVAGFVRIFKNLGFQSALVQRKEIDEDLVSTLFWVNGLVCLVMAGVLVGLSPLAARMYGDERIAPILSVLSLTIVTAAFEMVPTALLQRQMAFDKLAWREIGATLINGTTSIAWAWSGWGVWALVWGTVAGSAARGVLMNFVSPFRPRLVFDANGLKECLGFGLNLTGFNVVEYLARRADNLIIGVFLGATPLGYYSLAYKLLLLPRNAVARVVGRVLFPALSRFQGDDERLARRFLRAFAAISFVTFPAMFGFAAVAHPFVEVVLGSQWLPAVPLIWLLAPVGALQSVWTVHSKIYMTQGRTDLLFRWGIVAGLLFVASFLAGLPWGVLGIASAYAVACLIWIPASLGIAFRLVDGLNLRRLLEALWPSAAASGVMVACVATARMAMVSLGVARLVELVVAVAVGVAVYSGHTLMSRPPAAADFRRLIGPGLDGKFLRRFNGLRR